MPVGANVESREKAEPQVGKARGAAFPEGAGTDLESEHNPWRMHINLGRKEMR